MIILILPFWIQALKKELVHAKLVSLKLNKVFRAIIDFQFVQYVNLVIILAKLAYQINNIMVKFKIN